MTVRQSNCKGLVLMIICNPTGGEVRHDSQGSGDFGAKRGSRRHSGTDFVCVPGQTVLGFTNSIFIRIARPYASDPKYLGALFRGPQVEYKLFYFLPTLDPGQKIEAGSDVGIAQDISEKYGPEMTPHVHLEIVRVDPMFLMELYEAIY